MSSSRSDVVTQFVLPSVRSSVPFFLLASLEAVVFRGCFKGVIKDVSRMFQGSFKAFSRKFQGCFKKVSRVF